MINNLLYPPTLLWLIAYWVTVTVIVYSTIKIVDALGNLARLALVRDPDAREASGWEPTIETVEEKVR